MITRTEKEWETIEWMHLTTLDAIMRERKWCENEMAFQGGTSLHLAHRSPRLSEDLDFLLKNDIDPDRLMQAVARDVDVSALQRYGGAVELKQGKDDRNPRVYSLKLQRPETNRKTVLKCEFWTTAPELLARYRKTPRMVTPSPGLLPTFSLTPTSLPVADLEEIYFDKMQALIGRSYAKSRDLFDIWWMRTHTELRDIDRAEIIGRADYHFAMYPTENMTPETFGADLRSKAAGRFYEKTLGEISDDLSRWLPETLASMYDVNHVEIMRTLVKEESHALADAMDNHLTRLSQPTNKRPKP